MVVEHCAANKKVLLAKILTCILVPSDLKIHDVGSEEEESTEA